MTRTQFLASLSAIPFIGKLFTEPTLPYIDKQPDPFESPIDPWSILEIDGKGYLFDKNGVHEIKNWPRYGS